jgi:general secretion pathway protein I
MNAAIKNQRLVLKQPVSVFARGGFTLLEVLIALAFVAIALGAALSTGFRHTRHLNDQRERSYAQWVAVDTLSAWRLGLQPDGGSSDVNGKQQMGGLSYYWVLHRLDSSDDAVMRVEVTVHARDEKGVVLTTQTAYRAVDAQAPPGQNAATPPATTPPATNNDDDGAAQ